MCAVCGRSPYCLRREASTCVASSGTHGIKFIPQGIKCVVHGVIIVAKSLMGGGAFTIVASSGT